MGFLGDVFALKGGKFAVKDGRSMIGKGLLVQGLLYMLHGFSMEFYPQFWTLVKIVPQELAEDGWFRALGFTVFYIGLFYLFSGLADNKQFALVSVFMRLAFVSTMFAGFLGCFHYVPWTFALYFLVADSSLALITLVLYEKTESKDVQFVANVFCQPTGRFPVTDRSFIGKWQLAQGVVYLLHGLSIEFIPSFWALVRLVTAESVEEGWFRAVGFCVFYIGLFYFFAGVADNKHFAAVSVFMRITLTPTMFAAFLAYNGYVPLLFALYFAIADCTLAVVTYFFYKQQVVDARPAVHLHTILLVE